MDVMAEHSLKLSLLKQYTFSVVDSLVNIGPIGDIAIGESRDAASASMSSPELSPKYSKLVEMVTCSGGGKSGSLRILQVSLFNKWSLIVCSKVSALK